jgi:pimeloyl-ACP methyl ester carboxylesterase
MVRQPETRYAQGPGGDIAYQVVGDGPLDLVVVPGWISHVDLMWHDPGWTTFVSELASFARVILYDKRGTGLSDPIDIIPTLESRTDDLRAVLDAAGSERAALFGYSEGGPIGILFAATYPERVRALVLFGSYACGSLEDDGSPARKNPLLIWEGLATCQARKARPPAGRLLRGRVAGGGNGCWASAVTTSASRRATLGVGAGPRSPRAALDHPGEGGGQGVGSPRD